MCVYNLFPKAIYINGFPGGSAREVFTRILLPMLEVQETSVRSLDQEDPPEKEMATHPNIFAWKIPWIEEPGGLQSMGLQRVGWTWLSKHTHTHTHNMSLLSLLFILFTFCYHYLLHNSLVLFFITCLPSLKLYHVPFNPYLLYTSKISLQVLKIPPEISTLQKGFLSTSIFTRVLLPT